jgi:hypothetical protein
MSPSIFKGMTRLCTPALVYFVVSMVVLLCILFQNATSRKDMSFNNRFSYRVGIYSRPMKNLFHIVIVFLVKFLYIVFWTYILNLVCRDGNKALSWLILLFPLVLFFLSITAFLLLPIGLSVAPYRLNILQ